MSTSLRDATVWSANRSALGAAHSPYVRKVKYTAGGCARLIVRMRGEASAIRPLVGGGADVQRKLARVASVTELGTRAERKERTRRTILDAALALTKGAPLAAISIRQVARDAGIQAPSFYGHFDSIDAVGLALVEESFASLRAALAQVRRDAPRGRDMVEPTLKALSEQAEGHRNQFSFIVRERFSGSAPVRQAIRSQLTLVEADLAIDLARLRPPTWPHEEIRLASKLIVMTVVATFADLVTGELRNNDEFVAETMKLLYLQLRGPLNEPAPSDDSPPWQ